jgi:lipoate-protein ligase A
VAAGWRLLDDGVAGGRWNMAVDEALLAAAARGGPPTLRLYAWDGPWLSLGLGQALAPARAAACAAAGVRIVRRATGGRAVLHGADLTYAVAAPAGALPEGLRASYAQVAEALVAALAFLGLAASRAPAPQAPPAASGRPFDCFARAGIEEICVAGRKLVGSAQRRGRGAVLQHGSLRLAADPPGARRAAGLRATGSTSLAELGCTASPREVRRALVAAFERVLGRLEPAPLAPWERALACSRALERARKPLASPLAVPSGTSRVPLGNR